VKSGLQGISSNLFVETKHFVGGDVNVILTRQTCDQSSTKGQREANAEHYKITFSSEFAI